MFSPAPAREVDISVVVVAYDMARELPRTLHSLSRSYQLGIEELTYEVIVVDNGSPQAVSATAVSQHGPEFQLLRIDAASASPGPAINQGAALARGKFLGLIIDGARVLSPGVLHWAHQALQLQANAVTAVLGFHLGPEHQSQSSQRGYTRDVEESLLQEITWPSDGYRLYTRIQAKDMKFPDLAPDQDIDQAVSLAFDLELAGSGASAHAIASSADGFLVARDEAAAAGGRREQFKHRYLYAQPGEDLDFPAEPSVRQSSPVGEQRCRADAAAQQLVPRLRRIAPAVSRRPGRLCRAAGAEVGREEVALAECGSVSQESLRFNESYSCRYVGSVGMS